MEYQQQLAKLWAEVAGNRVFKFKNIFKDFLLLTKYDLRFIQAAKVKLRVADNMLPDCEHCPQNCCHGAENTVSLRLIDIARLLDAGLSAAIDQDNRSFRQDIYFKNKPGVLADINSDDWNYFPILKRVNNICPYLDQQNKCTIYKYRPITCRRFPYILTQTKAHIVFSQKCYKTKIALEPLKQQELFQAALDSYNEKVKDLILINYARADLEEIGLRKYLLLKN